VAGQVRYPDVGVREVRGIGGGPDAIGVAAHQDRGDAAAAQFGEQVAAGLAGGAVDGDGGGGFGGCHEKKCIAHL
jgi:hypothetical protein